MTEDERKELEEVKKYIRVDHDLEVDHDMENDLILEFILSAKEHITQATGIKFPNKHRRANLCVKAFVAHWYDNRGVTSNKRGLDDVLKSLLNQLKYVGDSDDA
jgi:uncharacterized phage protein (predicted DNA packaging)